MKKLDEIDLLKLSRMDIDIERIIMVIQIGKNHLENLQKQIKKRTDERKTLFESLKEKYEVRDFNYDNETGEIIEISPSNK